jgi:hypothetical protein
MTTVQKSATDTDESASGVLETADTLHRQAEQMSESVAQFLSGIRAA